MEESKLIFNIMTVHEECIIDHLYFVLIIMHQTFMD